MLLFKTYSPVYQDLDIGGMSVVTNRGSLSPYKVFDLNFNEVDTSTNYKVDKKIFMFKTMEDVKTVLVTNVNVNNSDTDFDTTFIMISNIGSIEIPVENPITMTDQTARYYESETQRKPFTGLSGTICNNDKTHPSLIRFFDGHNEYVTYSDLNGYYEINLSNPARYDVLIENLNGERYRHYVSEALYIHPQTKYDESIFIDIPFAELTGDLEVSSA